LGQHAAAFARDQYGWDAAAQLMASAYTRVLTGRAL
jgi:hypothetical protein